MKKLMRMLLINDDAPVFSSLLFGSAASLMAVLMISRVIKIDLFPLLGLLSIIGLIAGFRGLRSEKKKLSYLGIGLSAVPLALLVLGSVALRSVLGDLH